MPQIKNTENKLKSFLQKTGLLFFGLFLALGLAEMLTRFFVHVPTIPSKPMPTILAHQAVENFKMLYKPIPSVSTEAFGVPIKTNSLGFRDNEYALEKPAETKRIIFLGDSVVFGLGILGEETIPQQLENLFSEHQQKVEVLNLGVSGYETEQAVEFFKETGLRLKPDWVFVGFTMNDNIYGSAELGILHDQQDPHFQVPRREIYKRFYAFLFKHSRFFAYLDYKFRIQERFKHFRTYRNQSMWFMIEDRNKAVKDAPDSPYQRLKPKITEEGKRLGTSPDALRKMLGIAGFDNDEFYSSHWNVSRAAFLELKKLSEEHHFKVGVVLFPYGVELDKYALGILHDFLRQELEKMGFQVFDAKEAVAAHYTDPVPVYNDPIHFSPYGSRLVAQYLYDQIGKKDEPV